MYIYKITNLLNNKVYIGITKRALEQRIKEHTKSKKSLIGRSINKHNITNFSVEIVEELDDIEILKEKEIYYINYFNTLSPNGYNIINTVQTMNKQRKSKLYEIKDPDGNIHLTETLDQFCQLYNLSLDCMYRVAKGTNNQNKNWTVLSVNFEPVVVKCRSTATAPWENEDYRRKMEKVANSKRLKYEITNPKGISFCVEGLQRFCKENQLDPSSMFKVAKGLAKSCKKWKCKLIE